MADDAPEQKPPAEEKKLDLSSLSSFSLGPDWSSGNKPRARLPKESSEDRHRASRGPRRDRRGAMPRRERSDRGGDQHPRSRHAREQRPARQEPFQPIVEVDFYPEEEPFKVLAQAIRNSFRTFELFEIARLILDKPDRFVCVVRDPAQKEGETAILHASVPDGLPFQSEEEALTHAFRHYLQDFFTVESVEVEPPHGSFQMVHKCGFTGELLGPPNYHRFQAICREHHASKLSHMPYSRFEQRIESSREEADIQAWLDKMKVQTRYISKENPEMVFDNLEDARLFLLTHSREKLVRPAYSARFSGKVLALLNPQDPIRRSVEYLLEGQKRFPLETANHLRGRLRRMHFAVYKRGSKGISYVCAVKRRFRKPDEVMADNLLQLIQFIEDHPNFPAKDLPKAYLGIDPERGSKAPAKPIPLEEVEGLEAEAEKAPEPAAAEPPALSKEDQDSLRSLKTDLHYLVSQGYLIEYSDGRLFVPPIREDEIRHHEKELARQQEEEGEGDEKSSTPGDDKPEAEPAAGQEASPKQVEETAKPEAAGAAPETEAGKEPEAEASRETTPAEEPKADEDKSKAGEEEPKAGEQPNVEDESKTDEEEPKADDEPKAGEEESEPAEPAEAVEKQADEPEEQPEAGEKPEEAANDTPPKPKS